MGVEGGFEAALEVEIGSGRSPDVEGAFESGRAPGERGGGVFLDAESEDGGSGLGETLERGRVARLRKKSEVEDAAGARQGGARERGLPGKREQMRKKSAHAAGEKRDFENDCGWGRFEKERNGLADVVPEVGTFGLIESRELHVFCSGRSGEARELAGGTFADFGCAFGANAEMPGIGGEFSLERRSRSLGGIFFGVEEELHELRAEQLDGGRTEGRFLDEFAENESVFGRTE